MKKYLEKNKKKCQQNISKLMRYSKNSFKKKFIKNVGKNNSNKKPKTVHFKELEKEG